MANYSSKFYSPSYTGGYTSLVIEGNKNDNSNVPRGVIQVSITSGTVNLEMRLDDGAPWFVAKTYSANALEEIVLAPQMRVIATADAECWLGETH